MVAQIPAKFVAVSTKQFSQCSFINFLRVYNIERCIIRKCVIISKLPLRNLNNYQIKKAYGTSPSNCLPSVVKRECRLHGAGGTIIPNYTLFLEWGVCRRNAYIGFIRLEYNWSILLDISEESRNSGSFVCVFLIVDIIIHSLIS